MTKDDLKKYLAARGSLDMSDPQVDAYVEAARQMVLSADGRHIWQRLTKKTTLALTANTNTYVFPPEGSDDPPFSLLILVEGQNDTDTPIHQYNEEEWALTDFSGALQGVIVRSHDEEGRVYLVFADTPTVASTLDVVYRRTPPDDFSFIKEENHDIFIFAANVIIPLKNDPNYNIQTAYTLYKDRLEAAIANDYRAGQEHATIVPSDPVMNLQDTLATFQGDRA